MRTDKNQFLKLRIDLATLGLLERARGYLDLDKSKFIRTSIEEKAQAVIAEHEQTRLSADDWRAFFQLIENPPEPTERFKKATQKYRELTSS